MRLKLKRERHLNLTRPSARVNGKVTTERQRHDAPAASTTAMGWRPQMVLPVDRRYDRKPGPSPDEINCSKMLLCLTHNYKTSLHYRTHARTHLHGSSVQRLDALADRQAAGRADRSRSGRKPRCTVTVLQIEHLRVTTAVASRGRGVTGCG